MADNLNEWNLSPGQWSQYQSSEAGKGSNAMSPRMWMWSNGFSQISHSIINMGL
jgi:hypothetical protein